ncbi:hypothetical protein ACS0TY_019051 [Phlomoides rotata]
MVDAILSAAADRIIGLTEKQARYHVNLVRGAEKEVLSLSKELRTIRNVLDDAENRRFQDKNINYWLSRLEQTSYEMEDVLDEWDYALLELQMEEHQSDDDAVAPIKQKSKAESLPESWRIQSTSLIDSGKVHGRDIDRDVIVKKLMDNDHRPEGALGRQPLLN